MESHPETAPPGYIKEAVELLSLYVIPSIQVKLSQVSCTSTKLIELLMVRSRVTMESQPAAAPLG